MNNPVRARTQQVAPKQDAEPIEQGPTEPEPPVEPGPAEPEPPAEPVAGDKPPTYPIDVESVAVAERAHRNGFNVQKLRELIPGTNQYRIFYRINKQG